MGGCLTNIIFKSWVGLSLHTMFYIILLHTHTHTYNPIVQASSPGPVSFRDGPCISSPFCFSVTFYKDTSFHSLVRKLLENRLKLLTFPWHIQFKRWSIFSNSFLRWEKKYIYSWENACLCVILAVFRLNLEAACWVLLYWDRGPCFCMRIRNKWDFILRECVS